MKTILTLMMTLCLGISNLFAQTNYYKETKTFKENGYTYQCDVPPHQTVTLYNKENKFTYVDQIYKSTGEFYSPEPWEYIDTFEDEDWTKPLCYSIVNSAFTAAEKERVKKEELMITIYMSPDTGKVIEVEFKFLSSSAFATIPVSVYRKIEVELKAKIWFKITAEGKKLNYLMLFWEQKIGEKVVPD